MQTDQTSYSGKSVYIGLDIHRRSFVASCICDGVVVRRCQMKPQSRDVISLIKKNFEGAKVKTCYEAGFSGFWLHRELSAAGIDNVVVHKEFAPMLTYVYHCQTNGQYVEVEHSMNDEISTWGELCTRLGKDPGDTPNSAQVKRVIFGGYLALNKEDSSSPPGCCLERGDSCLPQHSCGMNCGCSK